MTRRLVERRGVRTGATEGSVSGELSSGLRDLLRQLRMEDVEVAGLPVGDAEQRERRPVHHDGVEAQRTGREPGVEGFDVPVRVSPVWSPRAPSPIVTAPHSTEVTDATQQSLVDRHGGALAG